MTPVGSTTLVLNDMIQDNRQTIPSPAGCGIGPVRRFCVSTPQHETGMPPVYVLSSAQAHMVSHEWVGPADRSFVFGGRRGVPHPACLKREKWTSLSGGKRSHFDFSNPGQPESRTERRHCRQVLAEALRKFSERFIIGDSEMRVDREVEDDVLWGMDFLQRVPNNHFLHLFFLQLPAAAPPTAAFP